jgi:Ca2+:H+ antiporter
MGNYNKKKRNLGFMGKTAAYFRKHPLNLLLLAIPLALLAYWLGWGELWVFILSALAIIPLAGFIGESTEALTFYTGPRIGGLLNATLGNAAELIITVVAIRKGLLELVKASITGSILGNVLLVLGMAFLLGGLRHGEQRFDSKHAGRNAILLLLAVFALVIPSLVSHSIGPDTSTRVEALSLGVAATMIVLYVAGLIYGYQVPKGPLNAPVGGDAELVRIVEKSHRTDDKAIHGSWSLRTVISVLVGATVGVALFSELLVGAVEPVVASLGISEFFLGVILIPIIGNVAEHLVAVKVAMGNKMDLGVEIAIASSLQVALFVAPILVFISLILGNPLQLIFNQFELLALIVGVLVAVLVSQDGESNWLEGAELLAVYIILSLAFFLLPF